MLSSFKTFIFRFIQLPPPVPSINDDEVLSGESESTQKRNEEHVTEKVGQKKEVGQKTDDNRTWADDENTTLIDVWAQYENLYNTKHKSYFNRDVHQKTLEAVEQKLKVTTIVVTMKQIAKKLTDLKNYYGAQRRMIESSKSSGAGTDSLSFLSDAFTPRRTQSNAEDPGPYEIDNPPSAKSAHKMPFVYNNLFSDVFHFKNVLINFTNIFFRVFT